MHTTRYSQNDLLKGILTGNPKTVDYIYSIYFPGIRHFVLSNKGCEEDAKDTFQEALLVLFNLVREPDFNLTCSFKTFIQALARKIWLKNLRRKQGPVVITDTDNYDLMDDDNLMDAIERNERLQLFREKFDELSPDCRRVLKMFLNNIPIADITKAMGYRSDQHTKNRRFRCKMSLVNKIKTSKTYLELGHGKS